MRALASARSPLWVGCLAIAAALSSLGASSPQKSDAAVVPRAHVVEPGQTLGAIALRFHVRAEAIRKANKLDDKGTVRAGQTLVIPPGDQAEGVQASGGREYASYGPVTHHPGVVHLVHGTETLQLRTLNRKNHVPSSVEDPIEHMLRSYSTGGKHPIDARLIALLTGVSDHFGGRTIFVVSGYRPYSPTQYTPHSNHNLGRAIDFTIPGVPNEVLRDYCRKLPKVGVGYYPNSTFVHMDVRDKSAFWVDYAGPGERPRYHRDEAQDEADEGAGEVSDLPTTGPIEAQSAPDSHSSTDVVGHAASKSAGELGSSSTQLDRAR